MEGEILTMFDNIRKKMRQCWLSWNVCNKASTPTTTDDNDTDKELWTYTLFAERGE